MNYRHSYHAGNFADVLKHAVLAQIITYLKRKDQAFRVIDTHAGIGLYDLSSAEAQKTGEWHAKAIGRVTGAASCRIRTHCLPGALARGGRVREINPDGGVLHLSRIAQTHSRASVSQAGPADSDRTASRRRQTAEKRCSKGDFQVRVIELDGWLSLGAHLPPKEKARPGADRPALRAGAGEYDRIVDGLARATRRFPGGTYMLWHPIKADSALASLRQETDRARPTAHSDRAADDPGQQAPRPA
jgi:23S rRNA (adenine2030-N6)-methyltransferase